MIEFLLIRFLAIQTQRRVTVYEKECFCLLLHAKLPKIQIYIRAAGEICSEYGLLAEFILCRVIIIQVVMWLYSVCLIDTKITNLPSECRNVMASLHRKKQTRVKANGF